MRLQYTATGVHLPILMATEEGDLVLDTFMGSGTTGRVSNAHKRFFVGYDIKQYSGDYRTTKINP